MRMLVKIFTCLSHHQWLSVWTEKTWAQAERQLKVSNSPPCGSVSTAMTPFALLAGWYCQHHIHGHPCAREHGLAGYWCKIGVCKDMHLVWTYQQNNDVDGNKALYKEEGNEARYTGWLKKNKAWWWYDVISVQEGHKKLTGGETRTNLIRRNWLTYVHLKNYHKIGILVRSTVLGQ